MIVLLSFLWIGHDEVVNGPQAFEMVSLFEILTCQNWSSQTVTVLPLLSYKIVEMGNYDYLQSINQNQCDSIVELLD